MQNKMIEAVTILTKEQNNEINGIWTERGRF